MLSAVVSSSSLYEHARRAGRDAVLQVHLAHPASDCPSSRQTLAAWHARSRRHAGTFVRYLGNGAESFDAVSFWPTGCAAPTLLNQNLKNSRHDLIPPKWAPYSACAWGRSPAETARLTRAGAPSPLSGRSPTRTRRWRPPCSRQRPRGDVGGTCVVACYRRRHRMERVVGL